MADEYNQANTDDDNASSSQNPKANAGEKNPKDKDTAAHGTSAPSGKKHRRPDTVNDATGSTKVARRTSPHKTVLNQYLLCCRDSHNDP